MLNRKKSFLNKSLSNNGFEADEIVDSNSSKSSEDLKLVQFKNVLEKNDNFIEDFENQMKTKIPLNHNDLSSEHLTKKALFGIPEESQNPYSTEDKSAILEDTQLNNNIYTPVGMGAQTMSLSNFKMIRGNHDNDGSNDKDSTKRDASVIQMKDIISSPCVLEPAVQTGRNFKKSSIFVISPISNDEDNLDIKIIDKPNAPELFIEFDSLHLDSATNNYYWIEKSRWLKFEEDYNADSRRFDSPHLSPLSIKGISNFRTIFSQGDVVLDCKQDKFIDVLNNILDSIIKGGAFSDKEIFEIRNALILKHYHAGEETKISSNDASLYRFDDNNQRYEAHEDTVRIQKRSNASFPKLDDLQRKLSHIRLGGKLEPGTEALSVQVGALESLDHTFCLFVRLENPIIADGLNEVNCPLRFIFIVFGPKSMEEELLEVGRVFSVMMSNIEFREVGYSASNKFEILDATKAFVSNSVLVPLNKIITHDSLAAMLPQMKQYFNEFHAEKNQKLFEDMKKEFSLKNQEVIIDQHDDGLRRRFSVNSRIVNHSLLSDNYQLETKDPIMNLSLAKTETKFKGPSQVCRQFCPPFRHFISDWKGLKSRFVSDFMDAFTTENSSIVFIGIIFIYFVVMAPAITFGALLNAINPTMTVTMMFLASGFFQFLYALFGGQPLEIIGITGPVFAVEKILGSLALSMAIELGAMRFWIGVYVAVLGVLFTAFNGVIIIKHIRRSVEEIYNFLVSLIFILSALFSMFKALPYTMTPLAVNGTNIAVIVSERQKFGVGGTTLFLSFLMANFCLVLVGIKKGSFFRRKIRNLLGSLNVPLGILLIIAMERIFFQSYSLPTLNAPPSGTVNFSLWFNVPSVKSLMNVSANAHGFCFAISISLFAILTCEISTNSILASKTERKLVKPSLYSINYFFVLVLFPLMAGILGWPFVSGAPVRSHAHCMAMTVWSVNLPGMPSRVTGAVEQRVSGSIVGALVVLSVFLGSALRYIPMAAMYGMFLYMGIMGSIDLIFIRRLLSILQRRKYWDAHDFLKDYPTWNIMTLVFIQIFFVVILIALNCISEFTTISWTPLLAPLTIVVFGFVRGYILPLWPRLNSHLSKMDKKHQIKLYADQHDSEKVILTVDENGVNMKVIPTKIDDNMNVSSESDSESDMKTKL